MDAPRDMDGRRRGRGIRLAGSARAFLAGFGTSGSLLAVAALLFIVASAMVAFRGWPHVAAQPSPGEVVVSPRPAAATGSLVSRRLTAFALVPAGAGAGPGVAPGRPAIAPRGTQRSIGRPASTSRPVPVAGGTPTLSAGSAPSACCAAAPGTSSGSASSGSSGSSGLGQVQQAIGQATGALGGEVSGTGSRLGSVVQQTTGAVGSAVQPVSPPAAGAVNSAGSGAGKTATGVSQTIGGAVSGLGQSVGQH